MKHLKSFDISPAEYKKRLDSLQEIVKMSITDIKVWAIVFERDIETAHALNRYRGMFLTMEYALRQMTLLELSKVFDNDGRTSSMRVMLAIAKSNREKFTPYATENDLNNLELQIDSNHNLLKRLKGYRNQRLAHHDMRYRKKGLQYGELLRLNDQVQTMFNSLSQWHDKTIVIFEIYVKEAETHTAEVIQIMREERNRLIESRNKLRSTIH